MSEFLKPAIITASVSLEDGCTMLADAMELLIEKHAFTFGYGSIDRIEYEDQKCRYTVTVMDSPRREQIGRPLIADLAAEHRGISISGDFYMAGLDRMLPIELALCRTFDPERPVCFVAHMDAYLYNTLEDESGRVNHEAADRYQYLALAFDAHELTDGFISNNITSFGEVTVFDGEALKQSYLNPASIGEKWRLRGQGKVIHHGLIHGIKTELLGREHPTEPEEGVEVFETVTGMTVVSTLRMEIDDEDDEDEV